MNLTELENKLRERRAQGYKLKPSPDNRYFNQNSVINRIERSDENYTVKSLLQYIWSLGYILVINGKEIMGIEDFGRAMQNMRYYYFRTVLSFTIKSRMQPEQFYRVERGRCTRKNLARYLQFFPSCNFELIEPKIDIPCPYIPESRRSIRHR